MKNLTAIIISFLRPGYTEACIKSLKEMYPEINIIVGENGKHSELLSRVCKFYDAKYIQLPYDSGVCIARNTLMRSVETEYVLVGDDDFLYDGESRVGQMLEFLEGHKEFDLIGGRVSLNGIIQNYQGFIEKRPDHFMSDKTDPNTATYETDIHSGLRYKKVDLTFNYFVARADKVKKVPWDEEIKVAYEHFSWFFDFKCAGGSVAFSPDPIVIHKPKGVDPRQEPEYLAFRNRRNDQVRFFDKYKIDYITDMAGRKAYAPDYVKRFRGNDTKFVDFCITTFKRKQSLEKLLFSIAKYYPMANVYIADQNEKNDREYYSNLRSKLYDAGLIKRISVFYLGYDVGVSYARNYLVKHTPNKYKLILDDDFEFVPDTDIGKMVKLLEIRPEIGVVGGLVEQLGYGINFEFDIKKIGKEMVQVPDGNAYRQLDGIRYKKTGCVLNFALFKKEVFNHVEWDANLKIGEHLDFFWRYNHAVSLQILYTPDVKVNHPPADRVPGYKEMRQRAEYTAMMMMKNGVTKIKYLNGQVVELLPDKSIKRYKEVPSHEQK